jgi:redox-sensing transcriptional repressor
MTTSPRCVARLSLYRRLLAELQAEKTDRVYSHELARRAGVSAAQVRRDIMGLGYSGTPNTGYEVQALVDSIAAHIDSPEGQQVALVGVGNLGRALLSYFQGRRAKLRIAAAFDNDPEKAGRVIGGCRCYGTGELPGVIRKERITVGIVAVPAAAAQETAELLVKAGVAGLLNFAPVPIEVPPHIYVEHVDITIRLETVAFFALRGRAPRRQRRLRPVRK